MANRDPQEAVDQVVATCGEYNAKFHELFAEPVEPRDVGNMINAFFEALGEAVDPEGMAARRADEVARKERERRVMDELVGLFDGA